MIKQHKPEKERKAEKMSQYHVYQTEASYVFTGWDRAKKSFSLADYKKVYSGELADSVSYNGEEKRINQFDRDVLEDLFVMFNQQRPEGFCGRFMSMSDVVEIVRKEKTRLYYCDRACWVEITNFKPEENL